jgi:hypothetical protein
MERSSLVNNLINSTMTGIALNANGYGMFVHNWKGYSPYTTTSAEGIGFIPDYPASQGISIIRSNTELEASTGNTSEWPAQNMTAEVILTNCRCFEWGNRKE